VDELDAFSLPPPAMAQADFEFPSLADDKDSLSKETTRELASAAEKHAWREGMEENERRERTRWLAQGRGRKGLRIVIVTGKS
jgi:hypothetical protein